jgi:hypothetical protein
MAANPSNTSNQNPDEIASTRYEYFADSRQFLMFLTKAGETTSFVMAATDFVDVLRNRV